MIPVQSLVGASRVARGKTDRQGVTLKPRRERPAAMSGCFMKQFQSRPVRPFSIMTTMGPWSMAM